MLICSSRCSSVDDVRDEGETYSLVFACTHTDRRPCLACLWAAGAARGAAMASMVSRAFDCSRRRVVVPNRGRRMGFTWNETELAPFGALNSGVSPFDHHACHEPILWRMTEGQSDNLGKLHVMNKPQNDRGRSICALSAGHASPGGPA